MIDLLKILLLPALAALGWWMGSRSSGISGVINRFAAIVVLALWLLDAVTGIFSATLPLHRALSQAAVIAAWIAAPLAVGVFLQEALETGDSPSAFGSLAAALVIPGVLLTAATGYLGPTYATTTRHPLLFGFLHLFLAPALTAGFLVAWFVCARLASREP